MARSVLDQPQYRNEEAAFAYVESLLWPNGPVCPLSNKKTGVVCESLPQRVGKLVGVRTKPSSKNPEGVERHGLYKCYHCRGQFTVRKGTVFEASHLQLHQWFQAAYLLCSSKKGCSSNQLARTLGCTVKTAWFASHRIREAMRAGDLAVPFGSGGGAVEADETFIGKIKGVTKKAARHHKMKVFTLVDRDGGTAVHDRRSWSLCEAWPATIRGEDQALPMCVCDQLIAFGQTRTKCKGMFGHASQAN